MIVLSMTGVMLVFECLCRVMQVLFVLLLSHGFNY